MERRGEKECSVVWKANAYQVIRSVFISSFLLVPLFSTDASHLTPLNDIHACSFAFRSLHYFANACLPGFSQMAHLLHAG